MRKKRSKRGRKHSFSPPWLWEGGSPLPLVVLQVFTRNGLKSQSLPKYTDHMVGEKKIFFLLCLVLSPPTTATEAGSCLPPPHTVNLLHCKGYRGESQGYSTASATCRPLLSFKIYCTGCK